MNWDAIGAVAEMLGAAGVLASLLYLGAQVRQNNRWLKQQAYQLSTNELRRWASHFHQSRETSELFLRGQNDFDSLDATEKLQFTMLVFEMCSIWAIYQQYSEEDLLGVRESAETTIGAWIDQGWFEKWYAVNTYLFPQDFQRFVEPILERKRKVG